MNKKDPTTTSPEPLDQHHSHLLCWKSVIAGLLITVMSYMLLTSLGAGIGGAAAFNIIRHDRGAMGLATGAGLWLGLSAVISLFLGSYFTLRISRYRTTRVGAAHGFVLASLFFIIMIINAGGTIGHMASTLGTAAMGDTDLSVNPEFQDLTRDAIGTSNLRSSPEEVSRGLYLRLLNGDPESTKSYLAYQTGLPRTEVDARYAQMRSRFDDQIKLTAERTAMAVSDTGWSLFVTFAVGLLAALIGGRVGAQSNYERPFSIFRTEYRAEPIVVATV